MKQIIALVLAVFMFSITVFGCGSRNQPSLPEKEFNTTIVFPNFYEHVKKLTLQGIELRNCILRNQSGTILLNNEELVINLDKGEKLIFRRGKTTPLKVIETLPGQQLKYSINRDQSVGLIPAIYGALSNSDINEMGWKLFFIKTDEEYEFVKKYGILII